MLLIERDGDECFYCGAVNPLGFYHVDHVTPRCRGGASSPENYLLACWDCNMEKALYAGWLYVVLRASAKPIPRQLPISAETLERLRAAARWPRPLDDHPVRSLSWELPAARRTANREESSERVT